jgi:hypothetical protein
MDKFLKIPNFQKAHKAFGNWMQSKYNVNIETLTDIDCKRALFDIMKEVKEELGPRANDMSVDELNNKALNKLQNIYVDKYTLIPQQQKLNIESLNRDSAIYGNRPVISNNLLPESVGNNSSQYEEEDVNKVFNKLIADRELKDTNNIQQLNQLPPVIEKDTPIPVDEFNNLLNRAQNNSTLEENIQLQLPKISENPKAIFEKQLDINMNDNVEIYNMSDNQEVLLQSSAPYNNDDNIIPVPRNTQTITKYILINGFDRDWETHPDRYSWKINLSNNYKNVRHIKFNKLVLPIENNDRKNKAAIYHNKDYKLGFQYVSLKVAELSDTYEGVGEDTGRIATCFLVESSYTCSNGRGYTILESAQCERKLYTQQLTSVNKLTITLNKPSGALVSQVRDDFGVKKVEFEYYNRLYLKVVTSKYFDKADFNVGDSVRIKGCVLYKPTSQTTTTHSSWFSDANDFINNKIGHEIVEMGDPNEQGFFNTFYIPAPTVFDEEEGKLELKEDIIKALREFNTSVPLTQTNYFGKIINMSLQPCLYMEIDVDTGYAGVSEIIQ